MNCELIDLLLKTHMRFFGCAESGLFALFQHTFDTHASCSQDIHVLRSPRQYNENPIPARLIRLTAHSFHEDVSMLSDSPFEPPVRPKNLHHHPAHRLP